MVANDNADPQTPADMLIIDDVGDVPGNAWELDSDGEVDPRSTLHAEIHDMLVAWLGAGDCDGSDAIDVLRQLLVDVIAADKDDASRAERVAGVLKDFALDVENQHRLILEDATK